MNKSGILNLSALIMLFIICATIGIIFLNSHQFEIFIIWSQSNKVLYFFVLTFVKFAAVVYPPLPGSVFTIGSIPVLGWQFAYLADFTGSFLGAIVSFLLAKKYGERIIRPFVTTNVLNKIKKTKIRENKEIEAVIAMRILGGTTIIEAINYGAGLLNISIKSFAIGFIVSHPLTGIPVFYFANNIFSGNNTSISIIVAILSLAAIYKLKGRYFE